LALKWRNRLTLSDAGWSVNVLQIPAVAKTISNLLRPERPIQVYDAQLDNIVKGRSQPHFFATLT
jgi:hypothetical protein